LVQLRIAPQNPKTPCNSLMLSSKNQNSPKVVSN